MPHLPRLAGDTPIYLDNAATTPLDPAVLVAMTPYLTSRFGNPSNPAYLHGADAADAIETARESVARLLSARPNEVLFTSGATESNNLAVLGVARGARSRGGGNHIVSTLIEHKSVLGPCRQLEPTEREFERCVEPSDESSHAVASRPVKGILCAMLR